MDLRHSIGRREFLRTSLVATALAVPGCFGGGGSSLPEEAEVEEVAPALTRPWGIAFLPEDERLLVTQRPGELALVDPVEGSARPVEGTPTVLAAGQGGLLDVTLHPAFPDEPWVYLTYSATNERGEAATHLWRGRLRTDASAVVDPEVLHVAEPFVEGTNHFGSRVAFGEAGLLYMTVGDRQFKDFGPEHVAQQPSNELGTTLRLAPDGSVPSDNPFVDDPGAADAVFTYGHRNPQGMTLHPETGAVWISEHGERDGDELNVLRAGGNYGWPVATEACAYGTDRPVGEPHDERSDVVAPVYAWPCSSGGFPPGGTTFYTGDAFPAWEGDLFVGNLAGQYLGRFTVDGRDVSPVDRLLADRGWRIRDVAVEPDSGYLYVAVDDPSVPLVRLLPA